MTKLNYTKEMKLQDKLYNTEDKKSLYYQRLHEAINNKAKEKGVTGQIYTYEDENGVIAETCSKDDFRAHAQRGEIGYDGEDENGGTCDEILKDIELLMNQADANN